MSASTPNQTAAKSASDWILMVDDEAPIRTVMGSFLADVGAEFVGAESGEAALQLLASRSSEPLVVFIDVLMPGMDGLTLARKLRSRLKSSVLVIISGHMTDLSWWPVDLREVLFVAKPFRLAEIMSIVTAARAGSRRER
ncbi:MAG TPA: response regulator [Lacunisphaera sp.]